MGLFKTAFNYVKTQGGKAWDFTKKHVGKAANYVNEFDKANGRRFSKGLAQMAGSGITYLASKYHPVLGLAVGGVGGYLAQNSTNKHLRKFGKGLSGNVKGIEKMVSSDIKRPTQNINTSNTNFSTNPNTRKYAYLRPARL